MRDFTCLNSLFLYTLCTNSSPYYVFAEQLGCLLGGMRVVSNQSGSFYMRLGCAVGGEERFVGHKGNEIWLLRGRSACVVHTWVGVYCQKSNSLMFQYFCPLFHLFQRYEGLFVHCDKFLVLFGAWFSMSKRSSRCSFHGIRPMVWK